MKSPNETDRAAWQERILVIRLSSLGDILLTAPAIRGLRSRFPSAHLDLLVSSEYGDAASLIPGPDRVLTFDRRTGLRGLLALRGRLSRRYTILVDLQNSARSVFLRASTFPTIWVRARRFRVRRWLLIRFKWNLYGRAHPVALRYLDALDTLGVSDDGRGLDLRLPPAVTAWAAEFLAKHNPAANPVVVLCPGARHVTKRWPSERWSAMAEVLIQRRCAVFVVGSLSERELIESIAQQSVGSIPVVGCAIPEIGALFARSSVVVSNDSGLMHLAAGVGARVVAVFGPTVEEFGFFPFRAVSEVLQHELPCRPCSAMGSERCPQSHFRCMLDTDVTRVAEAALRLAHPSALQMP